MNSLTNKIKSFAETIGFCKIGIVRAEDLAYESLRLKEWLEADYHGTMRWMESKFEKRSDPKQVLPGAKSVIAVAMNYYTPGEYSHDHSSGKISRYAWGEDYHEVLMQRLEKLSEFIKQQEPGFEGKAYVDTGPVLEKVWAQRAGIGWEGKHTNVITQEYGSWVFLGEIISNLELEYDEPAVDHCGSCTLCIEACPTQAIVEPYVLDSNRCISYLTIEHREEIPKELGEHFEGWMYGCDICQDVCPWNHKFSQPSGMKEFEPREGQTSLALSDVLRMDQKEFQKRFQHSPVKRTKLAGLQRNAQTLLDAVSHISS